MMGHKEKMAGGDERSYLTKARRFYSKGPGFIRWVKRKFSKRVRKEAKQELKQ